MKQRSSSSWSGVFVLALLVLASAGCRSMTSAQKTSAQGTGAAAGASAAASPASDPKLVARYGSLADEIIDTRRREVEVVRAILDSTYRDAQGALARAREAARGTSPGAARPAFESLAATVGCLATEGDASVAAVRKRLIEGGHHFNPLTPAGTAASPHAGPHHGEGQAHAGAPGHQQAPPGHQAPGPGGAPHHSQAAQPGAPGHAPGQAAPGGEGQKPGEPGGHAAQAPAHHAGNEAHHSAESAHHAGNTPLMGYDSGYVVVHRAAKKSLLDASHSLARLATEPSSEGLEAEWARVEAVCVALGIGRK